MNEIIMDCDLMRFRNSGLYYYCLYLGNYLQRAVEHDKSLSVKFYTPPRDQIVFEKPGNTISEKSFHRFVKPFLRHCRVWHAPFQSGRIIPDRNRHPRTKVLLTIHDLNALHEGKSPEHQARSLEQTQALIDRSDALVCISEFCRKDVLQNCEVGSKPVYVIHNGTNKIIAQAGGAKAYQPARPFLFGMGYVNRKKNYHVLLSLLQNPELELVVAGKLDEPDYVDLIRREAQRLGVDERVHLTGPIDEDDKGWYLKNCHAFVHPSLAEGFGAPVVEAMQFGRPVFLSNRTSLPEIGGKVAFYFQSFDADHMNAVFNQGMEKYRENGLAGELVRHSQAFNWEKSAADYLKVYKTLL